MFFPVNPIPLLFFIWLRTRCSSTRCAPRSGPSPFLKHLCSSLFLQFCSHLSHWMQFPFDWCLFPEPVSSLTAYYICLEVYFQKEMRCLTPRDGPSSLLMPLLLATAPFSVLGDQGSQMLSFPAPHPASAAGSTWRTLRCPRGESFLIHHNYQRKKTPLSALWGVILSTPDSCKPETDGVNVAETERQNEKSQKQKPQKTDSLTRLQNSGPDPETTLFQD